VEFKKQNKERGEKTNQETILLITENKLMATREEGVRGWVKWVIGIKECTC